MDKSLNQMYKESGTTLSYKEWRRREDEKMASFSGALPTPKFGDTTSLDKAKEDMQKIGGYKTDISKKTTFGIPNSVIMIGAIIVVGAIAFKVYSKYKQK
jgi:hypothetical protein